MKYWLLVLPLLFALPAAAQMDTTFVYSKTVLKIIPKSAAALLPEPARPEAKDKDRTPAAEAAMKPVSDREAREFKVEIRPASFLTQTDFIAHQPFKDNEGMLILIDPPAQAKLGPTRMITSADVLFADVDGYIIKIAPDLKLDSLTETIDSEKPIHAFVYLKAGSTAAFDIRIGDRIENAHFKTHPRVIE